MKTLAYLFGGRDEIKPSIAQILLIVAIFPFIGIPLSYIIGDEALSVIYDLLSELPIAGYWFSLLVQLADTPSELFSFDVYLSSIEYMNSTIYEACIAGMCIDLCKNVGELIGMKGVPFIQSILGIILGCILIRAIGVSDGVRTMYFCSMLIVLNIVVIWVLPKGSFSQKILATVLGLGMQMIVAVFSSGYVVFITLILRGMITDLRVVITFLAALFIPMLVVLAIDYFCLTPKGDRLRIW